MARLSPLAAPKVLAKLGKAATTKAACALLRRDEVIAYAQAKPEDGDNGVVIVLLKA